MPSSNTVCTSFLILFDFYLNNITERLSNLFNALPNRSTLRLQVYNALLNLATANEEVEILQLKVSEVERWIDEWDISAVEQSEFIKSISDAYAKVKQA